MIFKKIFIRNYRSLIDFEIEFIEFHDFYRQIYNNMNLNIITGGNGSGKSSLLAFISSVFHNVIRFPDRIESEFIFIYELKGYDGEITISLEHFCLEIKTNKEKYKFCLENSIEGLDVENFKKNKYISSLFLHLLPVEVTLSNFSIDSFFPNKRPYNFIGKTININRVDSHKSINAKHLDLSRGILLFFKKYKHKYFQDKIKNSFNLEVYDKVPFHISCYNEEVISYIFNKYSLDLEKISITNYEFFFNSINNQSFFSKFIEKDDDIFIYNNVFNILSLVRYPNDLYYKILMELIEYDICFFNDICIRKGKRDASFLEMSSGEKSFIYRVLGSLSKAYDNSLIIFDELESHLNILWTRDILWFIKELFSDFHLQIFISTHSYLFINSIFNENLIFLDNFKLKKINEPIFLANEIDIFKLLFPNQSVFSLFEESIMNMFIDKKVKHDHLDKIANSYIKFLLSTKREGLYD